VNPTDDPAQSSRRSGSDRWEEKFSEAEQRVQQELREIVDFLDREVVPNVRRHSSRALRKVADKLQNLATYMDEHKPE
jgi:hypothetical protein